MALAAFDGQMSLMEAKKHGDMGLGTFSGADGEMVAFDGTFYYVALDGTARPAETDARLPFAQVAFFRTPRTMQIGPFTGHATLKDAMDRVIADKNVPWAIQVSGRFNTLKLRSLPRQHKPYPPLDSVVARQKVTMLTDVEGTILGFWSPASLGDLSAVGCHFHFISKDGTRGGHVLDVAAGTAVTVGLQALERYEIVFLRKE